MGLNINQVGCHRNTCPSCIVGTPPWGGGAHYGGLSLNKGDENFKGEVGFLDIIFRPFEILFLVSLNR